MSAWRRAARECERVPDAAREPGNCAYCGKPLPRRKDGGIHLGRTSCSGECAQAFGREHDWKLARAAAIERDGGHCVRCGAGPGLPPKRPEFRDPRRGAYWTRQECWAPLREADQAIADQWDTYRVEMRAYNERSVEFAATHRQLEVNHIEPRQGGGYHAGCWNHLDNLETLCATPCHRETTTEQARERARARREQTTGQQSLL